MSRVLAIQNDQQKIPFYQTEHNQDKPTGHLYLDRDALVLEFQGNHPAIRINQAKARKTVDFVGDSSIRIDLPENPGKKIRIHLRSDGEGRFAVYGIREWTGIDGIESRAVRKQKHLAKFDSNFVKLVALWQLVLPYTLFGIAYVMQSFVTDATPEIGCFATGWQWLALTPIVAVHFVILLIPAIAVLFYNRIWGLRAMVLASLLLVLVVTSYGFFSDGWQFLPAQESTHSLVFPEYWLVLGPYMLLLFLPALYHVVVAPRM
jgi:hypothetical protein